MVESWEEDVKMFHLSEQTDEWQYELSKWELSMYRETSDSSYTGKEMQISLYIRRWKQTCKLIKQLRQLASIARGFEYRNTIYLGPW